jgi:hypothetical protein
MAQSEQLREKTLLATHVDEFGSQLMCSTPALQARFPRCPTHVRDFVCP